MKKNLTELVFILDRSGSMAGLEGDTIGGFNAMIEKQKREPGEALVSTVLFDNETEVIHDRVDLRKIERLTDREYYVRGCTALLDAVGGVRRYGLHRDGGSCRQWRRHADGDCQCQCHGAGLHQLLRGDG